MSHSIQVFNSAFLIPMKLTIVDYAVGGETVTPSEFASSSVNIAIMGTVPASQNSLGVPLFPLLNAGKVMLFRFTSGSPVEIAATTALNAVIPAIVQTPGI